MPTKERAINVDQDSSGADPHLNQSIKPMKFIFDAALSTAVAANGQHADKSPKAKGPLMPEMLDKMNRYWRAANYLCIGQIYLFENPLLREPLQGRTDQTKAPWTLGNFTGTESYLHSSEPPHQRA